MYTYQDSLEKRKKEGSQEKKVKLEMKITLWVWKVAWTQSPLFLQQLLALFSFMSSAKQVLFSEVLDCLSVQKITQNVLNRFSGSGGVDTKNR